MLTALSTELYKWGLFLHWMIFPEKGSLQRFQQKPGPGYHHLLAKNQKSLAMQLRLGPWQAWLAISGLIANKQVIHRCRGSAEVRYRNSYQRASFEEEACQLNSSPPQTSHSLIFLAKKSHFSPWQSTDIFRAAILRRLC